MIIRSTNLALLFCLSLLSFTRSDLSFGSELFYFTTTSLPSEKVHQPSTETVMKNYSRISTLDSQENERFSQWVSENKTRINTGRARRENFEKKQKLSYTGQRNWASIRETFLYDFLNFGVTTTATYGLTRLLTLGDAKSSQVAITAAGLAGTVSSLLSNSIKTFRESKMDLNEGLKNVHRLLMQESEDLLPTLPTDVQDRVQAIDNRVSTLLEEKEKKGDLVFKYLSRREEVYLALPTENLNVSHKNMQGDQEIKKILDHRVKDLISRYPEEQQSNLKMLISSIRENSIRKFGKRVQAYLFGAPGTGKTAFVELLGETLGLPVCKINIASLEPGDLLGPNRLDENVLETNTKVAGKLLQCFIDAGYKNPIVFFDDTGTILNHTGNLFEQDATIHKKLEVQEDFKKITDPHVNTLQNMALGIHFDTAHATFLFGSHYPLENDIFLRRILQVYFPRLTAKQKTEVARSSFDAIMKSQQELYPFYEVVEIQKITENYLPFILEEDEKRNPGGTILQQVIQDFTLFVQDLLEQEKLENRALITDKVLKDKILESFTLRDI